MNGDSEGCFKDPQGFTVPLRRAHEWQVAFSHQQCLVERGREKWKVFIADLPKGQLLSVLVAERKEEVKALVRRYGIPTELRQQVWPALMGADRKRVGARLCNK